MKKKTIIIVSSIAVLLILFVILFFAFRMKVSKSEALDIAYDYLDKKEVDFSYKKIERDLGDNSYEIELNDGTYKYEIEVDMTSGKVINFEKKAISNVSNPSGSDNVTNPNANETNYIGVEKAKSIALEHASLSENDVVFTKTNLEYDDGIRVYEIEFIYNHREYDYEIDAKTGNIIKYDVDR